MPKDLIETKKKEFNERFRNESWYFNNWEPIESFIQQAIKEAKEEVFEEGMLRMLNNYWVWHKQWEMELLDEEMFDTGDERLTFDEWVIKHKLKKETKEKE